MHAVLDEREARVKAELVESDALQGVLAAQQDTVLRQMEGVKYLSSIIDHARIRYVGKSQSCMVTQVIDELFREISEGLEVQVDQAQLEAKLRAAVESVRSDFDQVIATAARLSHFETAEPHKPSPPAPGLAS